MHRKRSPRCPHAVQARGMNPPARSFLTAASCSTLLARGHFTRAHVQGTGTPGRGSARRQVGAGIGGSSSPDLPSPRAQRPPSCERVLLPRPASQQDDLAPGRRPHVGAPLAQSWSLCFRHREGPLPRCPASLQSGRPSEPVSSSVEWDPCGAYQQGRDSGDRSEALAWGAPFKGDARKRSDECKECASTMH